jgi:reverse gyrase
MTYKGLKKHNASLKEDSIKNDMFQRPKEMVGVSDMVRNKRERIIEWNTFYRRNMHRFVEHYFGIKLYPYQILWLYEMSIKDSYVAICSRAVGKTWLLAVFAMAKATLFANSEVVIVSSTKEQAGNLIEKIVSLRGSYPNLDREILNVTTNMNKWQVDLRNNSIIRVVASRDSSRGKIKFAH